MDFTPTEEQEMLRDGARRFITEQHDFETARRIAEGEGMSRDHWRQFAELGWLSILAAEEDGGLGWSLADAAILAEELGRGLVAAPYLSNAVAGVRLLSASRCAARDDLLAGLMAGETLFALAIEEEGSRYDLRKCETVAEKVADGFRLQGRKVLVQDGPFADRFFVTARLEGEAQPSLFLVPADTPGLEIRAYETIDSRRAADLVLRDVHIGNDALVLAGDDALDLLEKTLDEVRVLMTADALGNMEQALELTVDYLGQRKQFGRALKDFQALRFRVADMFVAKENARAMVYRALSATEAPAEERAAAVSATMATIIQAGELVCGQAIQLHGGIGMTEEYSVAHHYKRHRVTALTYGDANFHAERYRRWSMPQWTAA